MLLLEVGCVDVRIGCFPSYILVLLLPPIPAATNQDYSITTAVYLFAKWDGCLTAQKHRALV